MVVRKIDNITLDPSSEVQVKYMGSQAVVTHLSKRNRKAHIRRLNKDEYLIISTGEVKQYKHTKTRAESPESFYSTIKKAEERINCNVNKRSLYKCRWVTLTYAENMTDTKQLYTDFEKFMKRFRYWLESKGLPSCKAIILMEPQDRGAWHSHILFIFDKKAPFLSNYVPPVYDNSLSWDENYKQMVKHKDFNAPLLKTWGHGWVYIQSLKNIDNIGKYFTVRMGDMALDDYVQENRLSINDEIIERNVIENGKKQSKKFVKGARIRMYPANFKFFRCSRGLRKPKKYYTNNKCAIETMSKGTLISEVTHEIVSDDGTFKTIRNVKTYNLDRPKK